MEMMLNALIKSVGIDPDDAIKKCELVRDTAYAKIAELDARLNRIESKLDQLLILKECENDNAQ